jgi:hypothetical protein
MVAAIAVLAAAGVAVLVIALGGQSPSEQAIAKSISLQASDLPGFVARAVHGNAADSQINSRLRSCPGVRGIAQHSQAVKAQSPLFTNGAGLAAQEVQSETAIEPSRQVVARDMALVRTGPVKACFTQALNGVTFPTSNGIPITIGNVQATPLPITATGADSSFGLRISMSMSALGRDQPVTMDLLGFGVGHDELSLLTFVLDQPFPIPTEQQLSFLLISRALAQPH